MKLSLSVRVAEHFNEKRRVTIPIKELAAIAKLSGYNALCMRASVVGVDDPPKHLREVRKIIDHNGLEISMTTGDFPVPENSQEGPRCLRNITPYLDLADALDTDLIRVCMKSNDDIPFAASAADEASDRSIRLAHQSHTRSIFETVEGSLEVLRKIGRPNFGIIYEPANLALCGEDYGPETLEALSPYLFNVYLQNHIPEKNGPMPMHTWTMGVVDSRLYPLDSGDGIKFERVFNGLKAVNYEGWITLHHSFDGTIPPSDAAKRSADFLQSFE